MKKQASIGLIEAAAAGALPNIEALLAVEGVDINLQNEEGIAALYIACANGHVAVVKCLLAAGAQVDVQNEVGDSVLHAAASFGDVALLDILLSAGFESVDVENEDGWSPLHTATKSGHSNVIQRLVERGAGACRTTKDGSSVLHIAAIADSEDVVRYLLEERFVSVDVRNAMGRTPLHVAANDGSINAVRALVHNGAQLEAEDEDGQTALFRSAVNGHTRIVEFLLGQGARVDAVETDGWTPLHGAAQSGDIETIKLLVERGADLHCPTKDGRTALHVAAGSGAYDALQFFVHHELDVNGIDDDGQTALYQAAMNGHRQIVEFLIEKGAEIEVAENDGWLPLHGAARSGDLETIELLVQNGTDLHSLTNDKRSGLHIAAANGGDKAVEYFVRQGLDVNATDENDQTPLFQAARNGHQQVTSYLVARGADVNAVEAQGWLPLHGAAEFGDVETVELLIKHGADVSSRTKDGRTALHIAAENGALEVVKYLIRCGLDANAADKVEHTALFKAALKGHRQIIENLLAQGANLNAVETDGWMPVHAAAQFGDVQIIELLVQHGAGLQKLTKDGRSVIHIAAEHGACNAVEYFTRHGLDVNATGKDMQTALFKAAFQNRRQVVEYLVTHGADVGIAERQGWLPLHGAAQTGDVEMIKLLLKHGADLNSLTTGGVSALHAAISKGNREAVRFLLETGAAVNDAHAKAWWPIHVAAQVGDVGTIELLLEHGADLDSRTTDKETALHIAADYGADAAAEYFVRHGLDVNAVDADGQTALFKAALKGHRSIVKTLVARGANVNTVEIDGWLPLHAAAQFGDVETIELLVQHGASIHSLTGDGQSMLHIAAANRSEEAVKYFIKCSVEGGAQEQGLINGADEDGWTSVHLAAKRGDLATMKLLVKNGADIHALSKTGESSLFVAARNGMVDIIRFLIDSGMDVNQVDEEEDGWSVLHAAAASGSVPTMEMLVESGADIHAKDKDGTSVLHIAAHNGQFEVTKYLVREGVDVTVVDETDGWSTIHSAAAGGNVHVLRYLIQRGADAYATTKDGKTALHVAISEGGHEVAEFLLQQDVNVNAVDMQGRTALHYACDKASGCVPLLLSAGAMTCLGLPDNEGNCPVHLTAAAHRAEETRQLLEAGADVQVLSKTGESPLQLAVFAPKSESAVSTLQALCGFGAEWTPSCQERLATMAAEMETSESHADDDSRQQLQWCQGLRACVLHWEQQRYKGADELIKVPMEVIERGEASVRTYLADATNSDMAQLTYRCKVCVVGPSEWGKSSLVRSIEAMKPFLMHIRDRTVGIDIVSSSFTEDPEPAVEGASPESEDQDPDVSSSVAVAPGKRHEVSFWDFAGQDVYQVAHALFFSRRTLYVLVIDLKAYTKQLSKVDSLRPTAAEAAMDRFLSRYVFRWVRTIFARQPDAEFIVLGTKTDLLEDEESQSDRVWRDLQSRIFQWKLNYTRELEKEIDVASSTKSSSGRVRVLKEKLNRLGSDKWLTVSVTRRDSIQAVRQAIQQTIETSERGFPMWNKYSRVLHAVSNKRAAANRPGDGQHRLEHGMMLFRSLCRQLMDEVDGLEYDECRDILRTLHDLGDVIWYEHEESGQLRDFIILDPMLVIDIVREVISHEHTKKTGGNGHTEDEHAQPRIDGRVDHKLLETFPLWKDMDKELLFAFKMLLKHFQLAYPANDEVMDPESDLIVPSYWKVQLEAATGSQELAKSSLKSQGIGAGLLTQYTWEYEISADLSDSIFEQFAVQSYTSFMTRTVRANCIESSCAEFESRITQHRGDSRHDVIRIEVSGENADLVWYNMRFYLMKLEKVLDGYSGLAVPRYVVVNDKRHSLGPVVKAVRDMILLGRDPNRLRAEIPWMPPDLEWFINRAWRNIASFQELQMMHLVRDKIAVLQKLVVKGESQRRYPALWSLEYKSEQRVAVLRMLSDLSGKCYHVPIEIGVPPAFLAKHGTKLQDGVSLLSNVLPNFLSVPILQTAIDCAASSLEGKVQQATQVHNLIEQLNVTTTSDNVFKTSTDSGLSPSGTMAVLRDLLKIYNDSLDELSITEICNLECAATSKGEYVWAHTQEISLLKDQLTRCQPQYVAPPALASPSSSTASTTTASPISSTPSSTKNELSSTTKELPGLSLCIETVVGLPDWDWYKTYCTWQLVYANSKTPLASGATTNNADSDTQPCWRSLHTPLGEMMSAEMLQECRLAVQVKRRSRVGWTKFIGEGEIMLRPLVSYDKAKNSFHCHPIQVLLSQERGSGKRFVQCQIATDSSSVDFQSEAAPVA